MYVVVAKKSKISDKFRNAFSQVLYLFFLQFYGTTSQSFQDGHVLPEDICFCWAGRPWAGRPWERA